MMYKSLVLPALASLAYAESTVTSMFIYGADEQPLAASIVGNDATATTYSINCPPGTDAVDCGMGPGMTLIAADDSTTYAFDERPEFWYTATCSVTDSTAICAETAGGPDANFPGTSTSTTDVEFMPVTITAGSTTSASEGAEPTSTSSESSSGSGSGDATSTNSASERTQNPSESGSPTETGSDSDPTGAAAKVNGVVGMVVGGAAVALMGAAI